MGATITLSHSYYKLDGPARRSRYEKLCLTARESETDWELYPG